MSISTKFAFHVLTSYFILAVISIHGGSKLMKIDKKVKWFQSLVCVNSSNCLLVMSSLLHSSSFLGYDLSFRWRVFTHILCNLYKVIEVLTFVINLVIKIECVVFISYLNILCHS